MPDLFDGHLAPITDTVGFLACDPESSCHAFVAWQADIQAKRGVALAQSRPQGDLAQVMRSLLPLTSVERRRYLFLPTASRWTAFLDNGHQGTDAFAPLSFLAEKLNCQAVRASCVPEGRALALPAVIFELYGPGQTGFLNYQRSISTVYDGKTWTFSQAGEIQPFEDTAAYTARRRQDRFTRPMLERYLKAMDIQMFDPGYYLPGAIRIEKVGPMAPAAKTYDLGGNLESNSHAGLT